jgi:hypothetical protein
MNNLEIAQHIANVLNEALALDPDGLSKLILRKEPINEAIALHPTIQVGIIPDQAYGLSPLGLINGFLGGHFGIAADVEVKTDKIKEFIVINLNAFGEKQ